MSNAQTNNTQNKNWYNNEQDYSSFVDKTPEQVWLSNLQPLQEAA